MFGYCDGPSGDSSADGGTRHARVRGSGACPLSGVATHYGLYNTVCGLGITVGNLAVGWLWGVAGRTQAAWLPWTVLTATGLLTAAAVASLARTGRLAPLPAPG
jgi:hypothetical protein